MCAMIWKFQIQIAPTESTAHSIATLSAIICSKRICKCIRKWAFSSKFDRWPFQLPTENISSAKRARIELDSTILRINLHKHRQPAAAASISIFYINNTSRLLPVDSFDLIYLRTHFGLILQLSVLSSTSTIWFHFDVMFISIVCGGSSSSSREKK